MNSKEITKSSFIRFKDIFCFNLPILDSSITYGKSFVLALKDMKMYTKNITIMLALIKNNFT